ncbi:MAG: prepilin-type N-terminal cleavage/methylation domain-containing protein [Candidatus Paceibacterota bacterium]
MKNFSLFPACRRTQQSKNNGFTLVETLVAVSIFSMSVVALMVMLGGSIADTRYAKNKIIAEYLAQEGIEYMRNIRDTYVLYAATGQTGWNSFVSRVTNSSCHNANGCYFDDSSLNYGNPSQPMINISLTSCSGSCPELRYDTSSGKYGYSTGNNSGFTRRITAELINNEVKISSRVSWTYRSGTYNITLSETLFNWIE